MKLTLKTETKSFVETWDSKEKQKINDFPKSVTRKWFEFYEDFMRFLFESVKSDDVKSLLMLFDTRFRIITFLIML